MRILFSSIVDLKRSAHNRPHDFVRHLSRNHEVTILCINDWWKAQQVESNLYDHDYDETWHRTEVHYYTQLKISPIVQEFISAVAIEGVLRKAGDFDVHFNYNTLVSGLYTAMRLRAKGIRTVYDIADDLPALIGMSPQIWPPLRSSGSAIARLLMRLNIMMAEKVTLTTEALNLPGSFRNKYVVLPNGVDTSRFHKMESTGLRAQLGLENSFVLGYVGVLREWIDFKPVMMALAVLRDEGYQVKLLIVGEEGGIERPRIQAEMHGVSDLVVFTGTVPYAKVPFYISCMNVGLIPFKQNPVTEGALPLKLLEYLACELPVVCSPTLGIKRAVGDLVMYATSVEDLVDAIKRLQDQPDRAKKMCAEGRSFMVEQYEWKHILDRLEQILMRVVDIRPNPVLT